MPSAITPMPRRRDDIATFMRLSHAMTPPPPLSDAAAPPFHLFHEPRRLMRDASERRHLRRIYADIAAAYDADTPFIRA